MIQVLLADSPMSDWGAVGGAIVAMIAGVAAGHYARQAVGATRASNRLAYFSSLRAWADEVSVTVETAIHICGDLDPKQSVTPTFFERRFEVICKLSGLLERGRWFFPNVAKQKDETGKVVFRGYRDVILNSVFCAYLLVRQIDYNTQSNNLATKTALEDVESHFVEQVLGILDPMRWPREYHRLVTHAHPTKHSGSHVFREYIAPHLVALAGIAGGIGIIFAYWRSPEDITSLVWLGVSMIVFGVCLSGYESLKVLRTI